jgi:GT2 family glycosyltransferase
VAIRKGRNRRKISIIVLSFNKREHTARCVHWIKETVRGNYEIILFDNGSHRDTVDLLKRSFSHDERVRLFFSPDNLGCAKGRKKAISQADGDYVVTLDNDIVVTPGWIEELVVRVEEDPRIAGACCRVIFPDNRIQYNGGTATIQDGFVEFSLVDAWKDGNDIATMRKRDCDWVPGGATLYKREVYESSSICEEFENAYEDNDFSFAVKKLGYRLVNCPTAKVIHNHVMYDEKSVLHEKEYMDHRYSHEALKRSVVTFYRRQGLIIKDEYVYRILGFNGFDEDTIRRKFVDFAEGVYAK